MSIHSLFIRPCSMHYPGTAQQSPWQDHRKDQDAASKKDLAEIFLSDESPLQELENIITQGPSPEGSIETLIRRYSWTLGQKFAHALIVAGEEEVFMEHVAHFSGLVYSPLIDRIFDLTPSKLTGGEWTQRLINHGADTTYLLLKNIETRFSGNDDLFLYCFPGADYSKVIPEAIKHRQLEHIIERVDQIEEKYHDLIAGLLVDYGYLALLGENIKKFKYVTQDKIQLLFDAGYTRHLALHLNRYKNMRSQDAEKLLKEGYVLELAFALHRLSDLTPDIAEALRQSGYGPRVEKNIDSFLPLGADLLYQLKQEKDANRQLEERPEIFPL